MNPEHRVWTDEDRANFREWWEAGVKTRFIAKRLNRSVVSVMSMRVKLALPRRPQGLRTTKR